MVRMNASDNADRERLTHWVREYSRAVRGFLGAMLPCADLAEDLTQEVFRRAWQARTGYREQGTPRAYLIRIADRLACDWFRSNGARQARREQPLVSVATGGDDAGDPGSHVGPELQLIRAEEQEKLHLCIDRLTEHQRRVLTLRYFGNMEFSEIAATMQIPLNTALSHCRRGLLALRELLAEPTR